MREKEKICMKGVGMERDQGVLYPPEAPKVIPVIEGEKEPIQDTVLSMKDERPSLNNSRYGIQKGKANPPPERGRKLPDRCR